MAEKRSSAKRRSLSEWQCLLSKLEQSGEDVSVFCRREGIYVPTLRWWQWRLRGSTCGPTVRRSGGPVSPASVGPEFTELRVVPPPASAADCFELRWPDGLTLAIPREFDEGSLRRLLVVLEVAGC